ncbi:LAFA_0F22254g1_1 [Lachancea sp. 'fantastica']|nr:LAFA_0F22254g1_1 [Lachancea sp. 'fantastica']
MDDWLLVDFLLEDDLQGSIEELDNVQRKWLAQDGLFSVNGSESMRTKSGRKKRSKWKKNQNKSAEYELIDDPIEELIGLIVKDERFQVQLKDDSVHQESEYQRKGTTTKKKNKKKGKDTPSAEDQDRLTYESIAKDDSFLFNFSLSELSLESQPKNIVKKSTKAKGKKGSKTQDSKANPAKDSNLASELDFNQKNAGGKREKVQPETDSRSIKEKSKASKVNTKSAKERSKKQAKKKAKSESQEHENGVPSTQGKNQDQSKSHTDSSKDDGKKMKPKTPKSEDPHPPSEESRMPKKRSRQSKTRKRGSD